MTHDKAVGVAESPKGRVRTTQTGESQPVRPCANTLTLIQTRFPDHNRLVDTAFRENPSFRDLCRDYRTCLTALNRWKQLEDPESAPRRQEYTELLAALGSEIQASLDGMDTEHPDSSDD